MRALRALVPVLLTLGCSTSFHMVEEAPAGPGTFRVAVIHSSAVDDEDRETPEGAAETMRRNFRHVAKLTRMAARAGACIVVTPEYVNTGVLLNRTERDRVATPLPSAPTDRPVWELPETPTGVQPFVRDYARLAAELGVWIVTNVVERHVDDEGEARYFNTMVAFDVRGRLVASYRKINLYFWEYRNLERGSETVSFDTPWGRFGMLLCFDVMWPTTWGELESEHACDFLVVQSYWEHVPYTGQMAMNSLSNLSGLPVLWSNQRRLGLGGGAAVVRPWETDTSIGIWGPTGVVVANLPLPERLRDHPVDPSDFEPRMIAVR